MVFIRKIIFFVLLFLELISAKQLEIDDRYVPEAERQPKLHPSVCSLSKSTKAEIQGYQGIVNMLRAAVKKSAFQNQSYNDLSDFIYTIGPRPTGSAAVIKAAEYFEQQMTKYDFSNVLKVPVKSPGITVGDESARMVQPRLKTLSIIGSNSINTGPSGIQSPVVVLRSLEDLITKAEEIRGNIVLFNFVFKRNKEYNYNSIGFLADSKAITLSDTVTKHGAKAILFRTATDLSLYSPHYQYIEQSVSGPQIPVATIAVEDADLIDRLSRSGETIVVNLKREGFAFSNSKMTYNVIGDYPGSELPQEFFTLYAHLDNVFVGLGAHDDGIGAVLSVNAIRLLKHLNLKPRRTITTILWGSHELSHVTHEDFIKQQYQMKVEGREHHVTATSADGCFGVRGYMASKPTSFQCVLYEILNLFKTNYAVHKIQNHTPYTIDLVKAGIPFAELDGKRNRRYYWYFHSRADTIDAVDPKEVDECLAVYAATTYILADLKNLPFHVQNN